MTSILGIPPEDLHGAFRRFYVWRDQLGVWRARPLPKLTADEVAYGVKQELEADTQLELAFACAWQRCRRNVFHYLQECAVEPTSGHTTS
ncbi:hypothetical protein AB0C27_50905 [Nonomuraea sp. NPDC048882]|uniref:hypothetical protein n=1 Tax=Nonomuraea sp. NPDC048882 TaxID=3154347 RepID=UPI0033E993EC